MQTFSLYPLFSRNEQQLGQQRATRVWQTDYKTKHIQLVQAAAMPACTSKQQC